MFKIVLDHHGYICDEWWYIYKPAEIWTQPTFHVLSSPQSFLYHNFVAYLAGSYFRDQYIFIIVFLLFIQRICLLYFYVLPNCFMFFLHHYCMIRNRTYVYIHIIISLPLQSFSINFFSQGISTYVSSVTHIWGRQLTCEFAPFTRDWVWTINHYLLKRRKCAFTTHANLPLTLTRQVVLVQSLIH